MRKPNDRIRKYVGEIDSIIHLEDDMYRYFFHKVRDRKGRLYQPVVIYINQNGEKFMPGDSVFFTGEMYTIPASEGYIPEDPRIPILKHRNQLINVMCYVENIWRCESVKF